MTRCGRLGGPAILLLLTLPLAGCGVAGDECEPCSSDDDCKAGLVCSTFSDRTRRCGSGLEMTSCSVR